MTGKDLKSHTELNKISRIENNLNEGHTCKAISLKTLSDTVYYILLLKFHNFPMKSNLL